MTGLPLHEQVEMVGAAYDDDIIDARTAVDILAEHADISPVLAARLLLDNANEPHADDGWAGPWAPPRDRDGRWT